MASAPEMVQIPDKVNPVADYLIRALMAIISEKMSCNAIFAATEETINEGKLSYI